MTGANASTKRLRLRHGPRPTSTGVSDIDPGDTIKVVIPGEPHAQQRHRSRIALRKGARAFDVAAGGNIERLYRRQDFWIQMYDPSAAEKAEVSHMIIPFDESELLTGPLRVDRYYYFGYRQQHYGTGRNSNEVKLSSPYWRDKRPDIDNYDKFIFDVLTGSIWQDDGQICAGVHVKVYSTSPRTEIYITQLEHMERELPLFEINKHEAKGV